VKKIVITIFFFLCIYIIIGSNIGKNNKLLTSLSSFFPEKFSKFIKQNFFVFYYRDEQEKKINKNKAIIEKQNKVIKFKNHQLKNNSFVIEDQFRKYKKQIIFTKVKNTPNPGNDNLEKFQTTSIVSGVVDMGGGTSFLREYENFIYLVSSKGIISFLEKSRIQENNLNFTSIPSNIVEVIGYNDFFYKWGVGIKSFIIHKNKVYLSFTDMPKENCYNTSIIVSELNKDYLNFSDFFRGKECVNEKNSYGEFAAIQGGGKIELFQNNEILFSVGDYRFRDMAQDPENIFGKIIAINLDTKDYRLVSMGHRNVQGIYYDKKKNLIFISEHGPKGGDEINILNLSNTYKEKVPNFGWPISSYGEHYGKPNTEENLKKYKKAPLNKSHIDFGFIEPSKYFNPAIAPSTILKIDKKNESKILLGSMLKKSIYEFNLDNKNNLLNSKNIFLGERVRDFLYLKDEEKLLVFLENSASIAIYNYR
tara:strand:+ start:598 stop:2031 length:1434 start_codon:yes stop_codon:yes gene_type:complete